ncbi:MAG: DUF3109 family protein [Bacteroidota bacterium]
MIVIDDVLVSDFLAEEKFCCDLSKCKGNCCVLGDSGAPLEDGEVGILEEIFDTIKPFMRKEGIQVIEENGMIDYDEDGTFVTPLVNHQECAFVYFENDIAFCAIEKAWKEGKISFRKPVSCHLYPIRISTFNNRDAVNYHHWDICDPARYKGRHHGIPLYKFTKDALLRKYGKEWYQKLVKLIEQEKE